MTVSRLFLAGISGVSGTESGEAWDVDDDDVDADCAQAVEIRICGVIDGLLPMASSMSLNHFQFEAVFSPDSVPLPLGGFLTS